MNLRLPKKNRMNDLALFLSRFSESAEVKIASELVEADENLELLSKQVVQKEKTIKVLQAEISKYKRGLKQEVGKDSIELLIASSMERIETTEPTELQFKLTSNNYSEYTQLLLLSDNHVEEVVTSADVGRANEYNWDIMEQRLGRCFSELLNAYRGERKVVVASLGDQFSGSIYDTMESTGKSLGQAIADYAMIIANYLKSLSTVYEEVYVPVIHGNHGRLGQNKKSSDYGTNNYEFMMANILKALVASHSNIIVDISTTGLISFDVGHKVIGCHHGDFFRSIGDNKFMRVKEHFRQTLNVDPDVILQGHTHCFNIEQMPRGGTYITNASLIGVSGYSHTNGMLGKDWGQVIMSFLPSGKVENVRLVGNE
jgi:predicted phosphodiesterase